MEKMVNALHENMKNNKEYSFLSLDQQGEFCVELAKLINNYFGGEIVRN